MQGLCDKCAHLKRLESSRGSVFYMCLRAEEDASFPRYPRLPVLACRGFQEAPPGAQAQQQQQQQQQ
jgi:hypothetical protein